MLRISRSARGPELRRWRRRAEQNAAITSLARLLSEPNLRRLAGARSYERGRDYAAAGAVARLARGKDRVEATVQGTHRYRVELWVGGDELAGSCSCPMGAAGAFCKHCVATGLAALEAGEDVPRPISLEEIRGHLGGMGREELVELLIAEAREDERLLDRLRLRAVIDRDGVDVDAFRDAIDRAADPGGFAPTPRPTTTRAAWRRRSRACGRCSTRDTRPRRSSWSSTARRRSNLPSRWSTTPTAT